MVTTRAHKRPREVYNPCPMPSAAPSAPKQAQKKPRKQRVKPLRLSQTDCHRAGTVLCDWLIAAYEERSERPRVRQDGTITASMAASADLKARVTALETLGLLLAAGLGEERHMEMLATEMLGGELPIRSVVLKSFLLVPGKLLAPHVSSCTGLLQASDAAHSRERALAVLRRVPASAVHSYLLDVRQMHDIDDEIESYHWHHWTWVLWTLTVVPARHLVSHHLTTIARASRYLPRPERPSDAYQQYAPVQALRIVLKRVCDVEYEGHEVWWSKEQIDAVVAMLRDGDGGVGSVLHAIHPLALAMGVPALLDVALDGSLAAASDPHKGVLAATRALNTFAHKKANSKRVGPPPTVLAQRIADALKSADAAECVAAAKLVGRLHRPLAYAHYPRLWQLLDDDDEKVRGAAIEALGTGAGALEVKDRMGDIQHELTADHTSQRALHGLLKVCECLSKPWPSELLPSILSLTLHSSADIATAARTALVSFHGDQIHTHLPAFLTPLTTTTTTTTGAVSHGNSTDTSAPPTTDTHTSTHEPPRDIPASTLLSILDLPSLRPYLHKYAHVIARRLSHDSESVRDNAMALLHHVDIATRRPHLKAIATACVQPRGSTGVKPVYVQMLRFMTSGLTTGDLEAVVAALSDRKRMLRALTVLRPLTTSHPHLLREIAGPIARCLDVVDQSGDAASTLSQSGGAGRERSQSGEPGDESDKSDDDGDQCTHRRDDNVVRVMAMRVLAEAEVKELGKHEVHLLAKVLLHAGGPVRREAVRVFNCLKPETLEPLAGWLLDNVLRSPPHERGVVKSLREVLVKLPEHCMRRRVTELVNALEMPSPVAQATAFDILMQMKYETLQHAMAPLARILPRPNTSAETRAAAIRIASRVPCVAQTSVLAAAVVDGIGDHEHDSVCDAAVNAIKTLSTKLVQENAGELIHAILTLNTPEVVKRAAIDLRNRIEETKHVVEPHLDTPLKLMLSVDEDESDGTRRRDVGFAFAKVFPVMCLEAHTEAVQTLLQHEHVDVRCNGFALVSAAYEKMYSYNCGRTHVYRDSNWLLPPLADAVAEALTDKQRSVRMVAQKAMGHALEGATTAKFPIDKITAALLRYGHEYTSPHTIWHFVCAASKELAAHLVEGDDATRLCILKLMNRLEAYHVYQAIFEREEELFAAAEAIPPDASMSVQLEAAKLLRHADPVTTARFSDGYVDPGFPKDPS